MFERVRSKTPYLRVQNAFGSVLNALSATLMTCEGLPRVDAIGVQNQGL